MNHYLPLDFPEAERLLCTTRAGWFARLLTRVPDAALHYQTIGGRVRRDGGAVSSHETSESGCFTLSSHEGGGKYRHPG